MRSRRSGRFARQAALQVPVPENSGRNRAPRRPPTSLFRRFLHGRSPRQAAKPLQRREQGDVARGPNVGTPQDHQEVDVGGPRSDPRDAHKLAACFVNRRPGDPSKIQLPGGNPPRDFAAVSRLLPGQSQTSQPRHPAGENAFARNLTQRPLQAPIHGAGRSERDLLLQNDLDQGREPRSAGPQGRRPMSPHDGRQIAILASEARQSRTQAAAVEAIRCVGRSKVLPHARFYGSASGYCSRS